MNLQRLIEQYVSYQRSLGSSFISDAVVLRAFGRTRGLRASIAMFAFGMWMRSLAKPGQ